MNAVPETNASSEAVLDVTDFQDDLPSSSRNSAKLTVPVRSPLRQAKQRWNSTLSSQDLQCLLQIIEVDLVPQLLDGYSPARCTPDDRLTSG